MENKEYNKEIYKKAKKRVAFKAHLTVYILVNILFWLLWLFVSYGQEEKFPLPWPVFPTVAWGIAIIFHYLFVFKWSSNLVEKEYNKIYKKEIKNNQ